MRIAYISHEFPPDTGKGGIGTYVSQAAGAMAGLGYDVHVFAGSNFRTASEYAEGYYVHRIKCEDVNEFRNNIVKSFDVENNIVAFDVMESPEINGNALEIKKKHPGIPLIVRLHAPNHLVESLKKKYIPLLAKLRFVAGSVRRLKFDLGYWKVYNKNEDEDYQFTKLANYIAAPSEAMKEWAVKHWNIPANKIEVIPNIFLPPEALLNIPVIEEAKYKRIIFFGRLNVLKGLVNATIAMKKILKEYPEWQFTIIGDDGPGPNIKWSMGMWMKNKLAEVIAQVDFKDGLMYEELPGVLAECEIVLLPSLFESFSYTCAEAMAAGKAVVGSNNAGMANLLQNGKSGLLINPYSHKEIIVALKRLIEDDTYRYQLSANARESILHESDAEETALKYFSFYKKIAWKQFAKN